MALAVYGVTSEVVLKSMGGIDRNSVTSTSDPSTGDIDEWIQDGAGLVQSALDALNIGTTGEADQRVFKAAIRAYAAYRTYEHFNRPQAAERALAEHNAQMDRIKDMSTLDGYDAAQLYTSNVRPSSPQKKKWEATDRQTTASGGFDGW